MTVSILIGGYLLEEVVITHTPYNFVNFKQGSSHMVRMAYNIHIGHVFSAACWAGCIACCTRYGVYGILGSQTLRLTPCVYGTDYVNQ